MENVAIAITVIGAGSIDDLLRAIKPNGKLYLPKFNVWAADLSNVKFYCTSGDCSSCRDSQAMSSWLLVSMEHFLDSAESLNIWVELCASYWSQFIWSPFHPDHLSSMTKKAQYAPLVDLEPA